YLWEQGDHGKQFYSNAATLPIEEASTFIRSATSDISRRLGARLPDGTANWRSFLSPISRSLKSFAAAQLHSYREMFDILCSPLSYAFFNIAYGDNTTCMSPVFFPPRWG